MKCPKCGNSNIKAGQKFCTNCGQPLSAGSQSSSQSASEAGKKGFIDNLTHPGTFLRRGTQGVQAEVRRERQQRLQRQAEALGMELTRPQNNDQQNNPQPSEPQQRRLVVDTESVEGVNIVSGRAIWNIQRGEIAHLITESEFAAADNLKGVIIQEGCTAMVYIDGQLVSMMQAGAYTFPAKSQTEIQLEQRQREIEAQEDELERQRRELQREQDEKARAEAQTFASRGVFGEIAAFGRGVMNFLFGKKKDEKPEQRNVRIQRTVQRLKMLPAPKVCRVYIVSNRLINIIFGSAMDDEGNIGFCPFVIPTKLVDVNIGVSMQLQINNIQQFVANYLADRNRFTVADLQQELMPGVKAQLTQMLRNLDYQAEGLPEPVVNNLKARLVNSCNERMHGIQVIRVLDITDQSSDFERFRAVERELFASEKELGYLQRTNEFRNRLEQEQNRRQIDQSRNTEELRQSLQAINKDKLLSEDEMEQFVALLASQKRIREANLQKDELIAKEEIREALVDMKKSGLVKDDELAALENTLLQGKIGRENVTDIMRVQAEQKLEMSKQIAEFSLSDNRMEHDMANALRQAQHQGILTAAQLDTKRLMDAYNDERNEFDWNRAFDRKQKEDDYDWEKSQREREVRNQQAMFEQQLEEQKVQAEYGRSRQDKFDDVDILDRKAAIAQRNMEAMKAAELAELKEKNRSTESIHTMDTNVLINRDNVEANMSAEQLMAKNIGQMEETGQAAFAQALGSAKENELRAQQQLELKAMYEQMMQNQNAQNAQTQQQMLQMAQMMQQGMLGAAGAQIANQQAAFNQQQEFQKQRLDDQMQMKQEYRDNMMHQQSRMDHTQDEALNRMGQVSTAAAGNINAYNGGRNSQQQPATPEKPQGVKCPKCGAHANPEDGFCMECGAKL